MCGFRRQQMVVEARLVQPASADRPPQLGAAEGRSVRAAVGQRLPDEAVRRQVPAQRRLHRQAPSGRQQRPQARNQLSVVGQPLDHGVGVEQRRHRVRLPVGEVAVLPAHPRGAGPRPFQHLRRVVHADHGGAGPALGQQPGHVAAAATEVVDVLRFRERDPPHQVQGGPQAVVGELEILPGIPEAAGDVPRVRRGLPHSAGSRGRARQMISR